MGNFKKALFRHLFFRSVHFFFPPPLICVLCKSRKAAAGTEKCTRKRKKINPTSSIQLQKSKKIKNTSIVFFFLLFLFSIAFIKELISVLERALVKIRFQAGLMQSLILKKFVVSPLQPEGSSLSVAAPAPTKAPPRTS